MNTIGWMVYVIFSVWFLVIGFGDIIADGWVVFRDALRLPRRRAEAERMTPREAERRGYQRTNQPWTPAEAEAFGVNDTERFIRETDSVLKSLEWQRAIEATPGAPADLAPEDPEPVIRRTVVHPVDTDVDTVVVETYDGRIMRVDRLALPYLEEA